MTINYSLQGRTGTVLVEEGACVIIDGDLVDFDTDAIGSYANGFRVCKYGWQSSRLTPHLLLSVNGWPCDSGLPVV